MSDTASPSAPPRPDAAAERQPPPQASPAEPGKPSGQQADPTPAAVPAAVPATAAAAPPAAASASPGTVMSALSDRSVSRLHRLIGVGGTLLLLLVLWEVLTYFVVYTDDAYVRSDLVAVAPQVTGPITELYVVDNQPVKKGDKLYKIDPVPFQLEVNTRQAEIEEQTALVKVSREELTTAKAALDAAKSSHTYAVEQQARYAVLASSDNAPRAELDRANDELRRATADMTMAEIAIAKAQTSINVHEAALHFAKAEKATAEWKVDRTDVVAPADGWINNLTIRVGDTATRNIANIGIVDAHAWRIIANYKEYYIRPLEIGGTAWVWLDSDPWVFHRARIGGIARGISRSPEPGMLLPYVAPTTDWIRLQRRIPVTIYLDEPPPDGKLYMGADARTVIFPR